jgi:hypothetical protein
VSRAQEIGDSFGPKMMPNRVVIRGNQDYLLLALMGDIGLIKCWFTEPRI